jgi:hypothetical protein
MKINTKGMAIGLAVWFGVSASSARADEQAAMKQKEKTYSGIVTSVDAKEKTVMVEGTLFGKTFNVADNCEFTLGDTKSATLGDLRAGQRVGVNYKDAGGVLVANRFAQEELRYSGTVQAVDRNTHTLKLSRSGLHKTFELPGDCKVILRDDRGGSLEDVKAGHQVTVVYELPGGSPTAREIEQSSATFVGTLDAIDASARTVKAKRFVGDRKFSLADNCKIVVNGITDGKLSDLRLGQKLVVSFEPVDGVNVANRIAQTEEPTKSEMSQAEKQGERAEK